MFQKKKVNHAVASVIAAGIAASGASIASSQAIEEVIVTATKSAASTQDIPVAVSAVTAEKMDQMGVSNFQDYLVQLPGVTAGGLGPRTKHNLYSWCGINYTSYVCSRRVRSGAECCILSR